MPSYNVLLQEIFLAYKMVILKNSLGEVVHTQSRESSLKVISCQLFSTKTVSEDQKLLAFYFVINIS